MIHKDIAKIIEGVISITDGRFEVVDNEKLKQIIDSLVYKATFGDNDIQASARYVIWETALSLNITPTSINNFYMARGAEKIPLNFTVPAINLRAITYDMAQQIFKVAKKRNIGPFTFELARSEMKYTDQTPMEYSISIMAAAIKTDWSGALFIQGDHFQSKAKSIGVPLEGEMESIKALAKDAISAGFYNIDIDMSTLVDLDKPTVEEQQVPNIENTLELATYIRSIEPEGITISLGGEIGHIGGKNSTEEDLDAYMQGFNKKFRGVGLSKISVQTGTHHGGVVLPDGTLKKLPVDFNVLSTLSKIAREKYGMAGAVQHGASTLPDEYFKHFASTTAIEIHFATGLQNLILDHPKFPKDLLERMYAWIDKEKSEERNPDQTDEQFHYKLRKKAIKPFKKELWDLDHQIKEDIMKSLKERLEFLFGTLNISDTLELLNQKVKPIKIHKELKDFYKESNVVKTISTKGLSD